MRHYQSDTPRHLIQNVQHICGFVMEEEELKARGCNLFCLNLFDASLPTLKGPHWPREWPMLSCSALQLQAEIRRLEQQQLAQMRQGCRSAEVPRCQFLLGSSIHWEIIGGFHKWEIPPFQETSVWGWVKTYYYHIAYCREQTSTSQPFWALRVPGFWLIAIYLYIVP